MSTTIPFGPTPAYSNPPIEPQYFAPRNYVISALALATPTPFTTTVTTSVDHDYVIGQEIRLLIPFFYGSTQLNNAKGFVVSIPAANQVVVSIDSSQNVNAFIASPTYNGLQQSPQILAIGDINNGQINTSGRTNQGTYIPGSFINISPN